MSANRRDFLKASLTASSLVSMGAGTVPTFLARSASAADPKKGEKVLVVVQLLGGNDGINTVVPHGYAGYAKGRRALRINKQQALTITPDIGLHPSMGGMARLLEAGKLSIIQGVGYPNPDRSHFRSMEIWETARLETGALETGWLGRALDARQSKVGEDTPGLHVGARNLPLALKSRKTEVPSLESLEQYKLQLAGDDASKRTTRDSLRQLARYDAPGAMSQDDPLLGFMKRSALAAYDSSQRLEQVTKGKAGATGYPTYGLARRLSLIAQIIKAGFGTKIYYTALDGFDTHANQLGSHAALLTELSDSLAAFHKDLSDAGQSDRVAVLVFSEFGRRVAENASAGTDHGAAAPVFLIGPVAKAGLVGEHPSFDSLDDGDLKHHTDFRKVYASLLDRWLGVPSEGVIGKGFGGLTLFPGGIA